MNRLLYQDRPTHEHIAHGGPVHSCAVNDSNIFLALPDHIRVLNVTTFELVSIIVQPTTPAQPPTTLLCLGPRQLATTRGQTNFSIYNLEPTYNR